MADPIASASTGATAADARPEPSTRATIQSHTTASDIACPACGAHAEAYLRLGRSLEIRQAIDLHHSPVVDAAWARTVFSDALKMAREG